ncbi:MAG TPA: hypothetical protein VF173_30570 [Thermoanaerobaculia bacterium]|nr:hypothetical protein [Thermoanaerobaculia bacterium]
MRRKLLLLTLSLALLAGSLSAFRVEASNHSCRFCTTQADGTQCCRSCVCNAQGLPIACTQVACLPGV